MKQVPVAVRLFVGIVAIGAIVVLALMWQSFPFTIVNRDIFFTITLGALMALSVIYPLPLAPNTRITISAAPALMAVFLLPQPLAVTTSLLGMALGEALIGASPRRFAFNVSRNTIQTSVASLTARSCLPCGAINDADASLFATLAVTACSYVFIGSLFSAGLDALNLNQSPISSWWQRRRENMVYQVAV